MREKRVLGWGFELRAMENRIQGTMHMPAGYELQVGRSLATLEMRLDSCPVLSCVMAFIFGLCVLMPKKRRKTKYSSRMDMKSPWSRE